MHPLLLSGLDKYIRAGCHIFPLHFAFGWMVRSERKEMVFASHGNQCFRGLPGSDICSRPSNGVKISHLLIRPGGHTCDLVKEDKEVSRSSALSLGDKLAALLSEA